MAASVRHAGDGHRVRWSGDHPAVQVLRLLRAVEGGAHLGEVREGPDASGVRENIERSSVSRRNKKKSEFVPLLVTVLKLGFNSKLKHKLQ